MSKALIKKLDEISSRLSSISKGKQINPKIADDLILIAQQKYKIFLRELFDKKLSDIISKNSYNEFILYSYKSYYGEIPAQSTENNQIFKRRLNLFRKGKRWSDSTGNIFYSVIDKINETFEDTPVNLFGELCSKYGKRKLIIKTGDSPYQSESNSTITLPNYSLLDNIEVDKINIAVLFRNYTKLLKEKDLNEIFGELTQIVNLFQTINVEKLLLTAKSTKILIEFSESIRDFFGMSKKDYLKYKDRILKAFFTYQFNDLEFDLYLIFPDRNEFLSTLMVATKPNRAIPNNVIALLIEITDKLKFLEAFEKQIVDETRKSNDIYIIWKNIYEREYNKLFTFMKSVENICFSVCKQNDIPFSHTNGRVKTFESLYDKIFIRSNDPNENERLKAEYGITYIDAIEKPHVHYLKIFSIIRDLAGVRVVLLFEEDLDKILRIFKDLNLHGDLIVKEEKFYRQSIEDTVRNIGVDVKKKIYNYRSLHITVMPGEKRLNLIEYRNHSDAQCEIQFRSVLAHAWADVNHDLDYKHREVIKEVLPHTQNILKKDFNMLSKSLLLNDKALNRIRRKNSQIKLD